MLSTIRYVDSTEPQPVPEMTLEMPDSALGSGYSESKWVSERILQIAAEKTRLSATVIRCGQMTGGKSGAWNIHEWFPSLVKSSAALGSFPTAQGVSVALLQGDLLFIVFLSYLGTSRCPGYPQILQVESY